MEDENLREKHQQHNSATLGGQVMQHWELFLRHVCDDMPFAWDFAMAARGIELAEACYRSLGNYPWETLAETT